MFDYELPDVVGRAVQTHVLRAAGFGQRRFDGVPEKVRLQEAALVNLADEGKNFLKVAALDVVREVGVLEDLFDQDELVLNLLPQVGFVDLAGLRKDAGVEGEELFVQRRQQAFVADRVERGEQEIVIRGIEHVPELFEVRVLLQLHLEDAEQQQFDDVLHALNRRTRRTKLLVELLQDVVRVAIRVMYRRASH